MLFLYIQNKKLNTVNSEILTIIAKNIVITTPLV